jgi:proteasome accessory factor A
VAGLETEYGFSAIGLDGIPRDRGPFALRLLDEVRSTHPHLCGGRTYDLFLGNGARLYIDCGVHPEYATPECTTPEEVVASVRAGDRILEAAARKVESLVPGLEMILFRANTDYSDPSVTWGTHESLLYHTSPTVMARNIVAHLVTRLVYTGAGGLDAAAPGIQFLLSPRVRFIKHASFTGSLNADRGIFHGKDEPLAGPGLHRLHIVCGESLCSEYADALRIGTTALVVALIDAGYEAGIEVALEDPVAAMHGINADPRCRHRFRTASGSTASAISVQRHYLARVEEHLGEPFLPAWAGSLCDRWRETLNALEENPLLLWRRLDWPLKLAVFGGRARRRGLPWPYARLPGSSPLPSGLMAVTTFASLRAELFEIDTRFSQLGPRGVFASFDRSNILDHRVVEREAIERAMNQPLAPSRARQRSRLIRRLSANASGVVCGWSEVTDTKRRRRMALADPHGNERPHWRSTATPRDKRGLERFWNREG